MLPLVLIAAKTKITPFPALLSIVIIIIAATILLISFQLETSYASSPTVNEEDGATDANIPGDIIPTGPIGPVGIVNELNQAHSDLSIIMEEHSKGSYEHDYPFTITFVDEQNKKLIVGMHPIAAAVGIEYDVTEIQNVLETTVPLEIIYAEFIPEATQAQQDYYKQYCTPDITPGFIAVCKAYANILINGGINPADLGPYTIFIDTFDNMRNWDLDGDDIEDDDLGSSYGVIPGHATTNDVATNDDECDTCVMELDDDIDLSDYDQASLSFWRLLDSDFESGEYVKVEIKDGNTWSEQFRWTTGDSQWHNHTLSLSASDFNMRITAQIDDDDHKFGIDNVIVKVENDAEEETSAPPTDTTPPVITVPDNISGTPRVASLGYYAEFTVTATDDTDGTVNVTCSHESGYFQIGITTVTCTATDDAGNTANASFTITVTSSTPTDSDGDGYHDGIDQCPNEASATNYGCPEESTIPIYAGTEHGYSYEFLSPEITPSNHPYYGTIGFTGYTVNGTAVFVGAAHTFVPDKFAGNEPTMYSHEHTIHPIGHLRSVISTSPPIGDYFVYESERTIDAALVSITNNTFVPSNQLKMRNGTIIDLLQGNTTSIERGSGISLYGKNTNSDGTLLFKNATVTTRDYGDGRDNTFTLHNYLIGNYDSVIGDSGGPIVNYQNGSAYIIGIHSGTVCQFVSPSENQTEINFWYNKTNSEQQLCPKVTTGIWTYYKGFASWNTVKSEFEIR